jgi:hypothetical protein
MNQVFSFASVTDLIIFLQPFALVCHRLCVSARNSPDRELAPDTEATNLEGVFLA